MAVQKKYPENYNYGTGAARYYHGDKAPGVFHNKGVENVGRRYDYSKSPLAPRPNSTSTQNIPRNEWSANQEKIFAKIQKDIAAKVAAKRAGKAKPVGKTPPTAADLVKEKMLQAAKAAPKNAVLHWHGVSTCFDSLTYSKKTGVLHAVFLKRDDGSGWDYDLDLEDAVDFMMDASPGGWFNAELR
jgi:hypothetical protein